MNKHHQDTKRETASKKLEQERLQILLNELLKDDENKYCADCEAKGPRWASWNLGVFLCIRCAGIHRNLGVHVSKVKSVNLDTWTLEQVQSVRVFGNSVGKAVYEAHLPEHFRRPQTDSALETFIRAKYEQKRYAMKDWQAPKVDVKPLLAELENFHARKKISSSPALTSLVDKKSPVTLNVEQTPSRNQKSANRPSSTDRRRRSKNNSLSESAKNDSAPQQTESKTGNGAVPSLADDLLGLTINAPASSTTGASLIDDMSGEFGSFATATAPPVDLATELGAAGLDSDKALLDTTAKGANEKKTKDDILALYGSSTSLSMPNIQAQQVFGSMTSGAHSFLAQQTPPSAFQQAQQHHSASSNMALLAGLQPASFAPQQMPATGQSFVPGMSANFAACNPFHNASTQPGGGAGFNFAPASGAEQAAEQSARLRAVQDQLAALQSQKSAPALPAASTTISSDLWQ